MFLPRPQLTEQIMQSIAAHSLTAVVAPMGYGKSTLARAVLEKQTDAYYYAVPAGPHDGHFLWHDMCAAFEARGLAIAPDLRRLGLPESASQARQALDLLRGLGGAGGPVCLILDDYHYVTDPLMDSFLERAAREAGKLRLLLLSRTVPGVNLAELRLKGLAALFEQNLLAFSPEETEAFFRVNGVQNPLAATESQRYSEGWPAVLWLCLQSWQHSGRIAASMDIDSLLASAVFTAYSPDERDLLLRLSVFETFTEADAEKIASEAGWLPVSLIELRQKNAFLSFDASGFYQFHSIFRDFLRKRLAVTAHIDKPSLYRLAGECCFNRHDHISAFRLFRQAGRDEDLGRLLDTFRYAADDRNIFYFAEECFSVADLVPWRVRLANPLGWLAFVGLYTMMWKDRRAAALLDEAEKRFQAAPEISENMKKGLQGSIEIVHAFMAFNDPDRMFGHYSQAVRLLGGPSRFLSDDFPWNCGSPNLSFAVVREPGTYEALPEQGAELLHLYNILSGGKTKDYEKIIFAEYFLERGDFSRTEPIFTDMLANGADDERQQMGSLIATFGLARLFVAQGDTKKALSIMEGLRPSLEAADLVYILDGLDVAQGYVNAVLGRLDAIPRWLREGAVFDPPHNVMPHIFGISLTVYAKALILQGDWPSLAAAAKKIPDAAPLVYLFARIHGKILESVAAWHTQGRNQALDLLTEALDLSRPDGLVLPLAEYGRHILPLLRHLKRNGLQGWDDAHLEAVLALAGRIARLAAAPGKAPKGLLTPREQEVMRHVAAGKTNPAIAEELHISVNAVKYMVGRASAKLGAYGRLGAARRFTELYGKTQHLPAE